MLLCANSCMDRGITVGMTIEYLDFFVVVLLDLSGSEEVFKQQMLSTHCIINH